MPALFITATGTGVGKTTLAATLVHQLNAAGHKARALKPVLSGYDAADATNDAAVLLRAGGREADAAAQAAIAPWRFAAPLSPDMAAAREGRTIDVAALVAWCRKQMHAEGWTLIEGIGGAFVPLDAHSLVVDWMAALGCPFLLVAGSYLGTLSHTIATVEALAARGLRPHALVLSDRGDGPLPAAETASALGERLRRPVHILPPLDGARPWSRAPDLLAPLGMN